MLQADPLRPASGAEPAAKIRLEPNTTLYPVPVVLITCGTREQVNIFSLNRIASCNAEPPMISISVRPARASHALIEQYGEFVVNIPWPHMEIVSDFVGSTTMAEADKWGDTGLTRLPAACVNPPLISECPVNVECRVLQTIQLSSHSLFISEVVALHADKHVLDDRNEVDIDLAGGGMRYRAGPVQERPIENFRPEYQRRAVHAWRDGETSE